jgi:hypothetical protein
MNTIIDVEGLKDLALGLGVSAAGGGGSFIQGIEIINEIINDEFTEIELQNIQSISENDFAVVAGGIGKPDALSKPIEFAERMSVVLQQYEENYTKISGFSPIEVGPINGLLPIAIAHKNPSYCVYDCDGGGRAVPSLTTLMYDELQKADPVAYAWKTVDATPDINTYLVTSEESSFRGSEAELFFSSVMSIGAVDPSSGDKDANGAIPFACWGFDKNNQPEIPYSTYSIRKNQGRLLRDLLNIDDISLYHTALIEMAAKAEKDDYVNLSFKSVIDEVKQINHPRWTCGWIVFDSDIDANTQKRLYFVNENAALVEVTNTDDVNTFNILATGPSLIYTLIKDDEPEKIIKDTFDVSSGWFPYNTGELDTIKRLKGSEIFVGVIGSTPEEGQSPLLMVERADNFIDVQRSTFETLRTYYENGIQPYLNEFPSETQMSEVYPKPYDSMQSAKHSSKQSTKGYMFNPLIRNNWK